MARGVRQGCRQQVPVHDGIWSHLQMVVSCSDSKELFLTSLVAAADDFA